jgi:hypothetical protein
LPVAICERARRLQLRGQLRTWDPGLGRPAPHSQLIPRRSASLAGTRA